MHDDMLEIGPNMYNTTVVYSFISARCRLEKIGELLPSFMGLLLATMQTFP